MGDSFLLDWVLLLGSSNGDVTVTELWFELLCTRAMSSFKRFGNPSVFRAACVFVFLLFSFVVFVASVFREGTRDPRYLGLQFSGLRSLRDVPSSAALCFQSFVLCVSRAGR